MSRCCWGGTPDCSSTFSLMRVICSAIGQRTRYSASRGERRALSSFSMSSSICRQSARWPQCGACAYLLARESLRARQQGRVCSGSARPTLTLMIMLVEERTERGVAGEGRLDRHSARRARIYLHPVAVALSAAFFSSKTLSARLLLPLNIYEQFPVGRGRSLSECCPNTLCRDVCA